MELATAVAVFGRQLICETGNELLPCSALGSLLRRHGPLAAGDRVRLERSGDGGIVRQLLPRATALMRAPRRPGQRPLMVAANVDYALVVLSIHQPDFRAGLADRVLAAASIAGIDAGICVNKWDLAEPGDDDAIAPYEAAGIRVLRTSALSGQGCSALAEHLTGRAAVVVGHSGVGKSSLLTHLVPGIEVRVNAVNAVTGRGRHTTTTATLVRLPGEGSLVDTPGIRAFGLVGTDPSDLARHFPEFHPHLGQCSFEDCGHDTEPGCSIREAVERGEIALIRYEGYLRIRESLQQGRG